MWPCKTLKTWGSSSMLRRRMILPIVVTRGSREDLKTGPSISLNVSNSTRCCSALSIIERNLYIVKTRPFKPQRFCLNKTGPGEVSLIRRAAGNMTSGPKMMRMSVAKRISRIRRTNINPSFVGVVLKERSGKPSNSSNSIRAIE